MSTSSRATTAPDVDPVTVELVRNLLVGAVDELEENIVLAAHGVAIYMIRDMAVGWLDADLRTITQGRRGLPIFQADFDHAVRDGLEIYGHDGFEPGDVVITNHSETCGQHLNHMVVYSPIFLEGEIIAWTACRTHWSDVGGTSEGSVRTDSRDIFGEGIQLRTVKIVKRGEVDEEILRIIRHNTRFPDMNIGDLNAQLAACRLGDTRFLGLIEKYGREVIFECVRRIWDQSEAEARAAVARIPDGDYEAETFLDDDGIDFGHPIRIRTKVSVRGSDMTVDLSDLEPQTEGPINSRAGAAAVRIAFKYLTTKELPTDDGCFRPLTVVIPDGTIVSARGHASMGMWTLPLPSLIGTVVKALAEVIPDEIAAAHGHFTPWATWGTCAGERYYHITPALPGWGATSTADGVHGLRPNVYGQSRDVPVELEERNAPLHVRHHRLRTDSGGAGRHRGGLGTEREYEILNAGHIMVWTDGTQHSAWGIAGGHDGGPSGAHVTHPDGSEHDVRKTTGEAIPQGSIIRVWAGGGGGFGDPTTREPERVLADVAEGLVSVESARDLYAVALRSTPDGYEIDQQETERLRGA